MVPRLVLALAVAVAVSLFGQLPGRTAPPPEAPTPLLASPVQGGVSVIGGEGGNIGVLTGPDGTLLVDSKFARLATPVRGAVKALGGGDPAWLINTHFHFDHTDGNAGFARTGARIVAHTTVRRRLAEGSTIPAFSMVTPPAPPEALPVISFDTTLQLLLDGQTIELRHLPAAHTDGDVVVQFRQANVIHAGDVWFNGMYPFIDTLNGGTLAGAIAGVDQVLELADDDTRIIPGHGPVGSKADLQAYRTMLATAQQRLTALKQQGLAVEAVVAAAPLADLEERWGQGLFAADRWIQVIWEGI
ncbi:beta-lactamase domain protein [Cyanobium sp. PCC 7001]|uniref:MBL fold metallo-hydrolase n=1 Tax=Cyanobium sp. PCC 7001 TaxID=180281 RepID=UPI00018053F8|nr:MBL fold metallo-hydrolase [Cyanobium sp. PCC 7001]EDY37488.1 beta-lactamase domain protein [Cyanobium sp. PCC 7001]